VTLTVGVNGAVESTLNGAGVRVFRRSVANVEHLFRVDQRANGFFRFYTQQLLKTSSTHEHDEFRSIEDLKIKRYVDVNENVVFGGTLRG